MEKLLAFNGIQEMITKVGNLKEIKLSDGEGESGASFISGTEKFVVLFEQKIDIVAELERVDKELK